MPAIENDFPVLKQLITNAFGRNDAFLFSMTLQALILHLSVLCLLKCYRDFLMLHECGFVSNFQDVGLLERRRISTNLVIFTAVGHDNICT